MDLSKILSFLDKKESDIEENSKFFFHDVINQTHGLKLFLESKMVVNKDVVTSEIELMYRELVVLEKMIQTHFKFDHKNLSSHELISVEILKSEISKIVSTYFPQSSDATIVYHGLIGNQHPYDFRMQFLINHLSFHRIFRNIIKNAKEANSIKIKIDIDVTNEFLTLEVANQFDQAERERKLEYNLLHFSEKQEEKHQSLGLNSIACLVEKLGGTSSFSLDGDIFKSTIKFPVHQSKIEQNAA